MLWPPMVWPAWQGEHLAMKTGCASCAYVTATGTSFPPPSIGEVDAGRQPASAAAAASRGRRRCVKVIDFNRGGRDLSRAGACEAGDVEGGRRRREIGREAVAELTRVVGAPAADAAAGHQRAGVGGSESDRAHAAEV